MEWLDMAAVECICFPSALWDKAKLGHLNGISEEFSAVWLLGYPGTA